MKYDPTGLAHPSNEHYTPVSLLKREALRFDTRVRFMLDTLWKACDDDRSGSIDKQE